MKRHRLRQAMRKLARAGREFLDGGGDDPYAPEDTVKNPSGDPVPEIQVKIAEAAYAGWNVDGLSNQVDTFADLYAARRIMHAGLIHAWMMDGITVVKSTRAEDNELFDGGESFVVAADLPTGQVWASYPMHHWDQFRCPVIDRAPRLDSHSTSEALERISTYLYMTRGDDATEVHVCVGRIGVPTRDGRGLADTGTIAHRELPIRVVVHQSDVAEPACNTLVHRIYRSEDRIIAVVSSTDPKVMDDLKTGASVVSMDLFVDGPTATYQGNVIATSWKIIGFALMDATTSAW